MKIRLLKDHVPNCSAVATVERGDWDTPWFLCGKNDASAGRSYGYQTVRRDSIGRQNGGCHSWAVFICNDTNCDANGIVRVGDIEVGIHEAAKELE